MRLRNLIYIYISRDLFENNFKFFFTLLNDIYITRMIMSNGTNWHLLNIVYTLIRVGRGGGGELLFRTMYVCMYVWGGAGETLRLKYTMGIRAMTKNYFVGRGGEEEEQGEEKRKTEK